MALGMIGDMRAVDPFFNIFRSKENFLDKFTFLKERVIEALGKFSIPHNKRVFSRFKNALLDDSPQVRLNAVESLMNLELKKRSFGAAELIKKCSMILMKRLQEALSRRFIIYQAKRF